MKAKLINIIYRFQQLYNHIISLFIRYDYESKKSPSVSKDNIIEYNKSRSKGPKKILCYAPYKHMYFGIGGIVGACCANKSEIYGKQSEGTIENLFHSNSIKFLRTRIEDYNLSGGCYFCNQQLQTRNYNAFIGSMYDDFMEEIPSHFPTEMTFEISNTCNLECIMCDGNFSSSIRKNREKLPPLEDKYGADFFEQIKEAIPYLKVARFQGGEPFLITPYYDIIESIIHTNSNCVIYIQTNGTILNERVKKIIEHKNVHLSISIDSLTKSTYEYIRKNASFDRLMQHMQYFISRAKDYRQLININFCVMTTNWQEVPSMLAFCNKNNFTLTLIPVESPYELSLHFLESEQLEKIIQYYQKPENLNLLNKNKFNKEKYNDLICSLQFYNEKQSLKNKKQEQLMQLDNEALRKQVISYFDDKLFDGVDLSPVHTLIDKSILTLDAEQQKKLLVEFLTDLHIHHSSLLSDFINNKHWPPDFVTYIKTTLNKHFPNV